MNEHARSIYQAAMDGKTVQRWLSNEWQDENPFECIPSKCPARFPEIWRVKPKYRFERRYSRAYLVKPENVAEIYNHTSDESLTELRNMECFGGWISDWLVCEVEVEE